MAHRKLKEKNMSVQLLFFLCVIVLVYHLAVTPVCLCALPDLHKHV